MTEPPPLTATNMSPPAPTALAIDTNRLQEVGGLTYGVTAGEGTAVALTATATVVAALHALFG